MSEPILRMLRLELDSARLARQGFEARLPPGQDDSGFLVHRALCGLFGEGVVQPFRILDVSTRHIPVLAYTHKDETELRDHAAAFADPAFYAACGWEGLASKPIPELAVGRRLGFELRSCPVARLAKDVDVAAKNGEPQRYRSGAEVDLWLHRRYLAPTTTAATTTNPAVTVTDTSREMVYATWLRDRLGESVEVESVQLKGFRRMRLVRQDHTQTRKAKILERPEALLGGVLTVRDALAFRRVLARGVGRHRAFGFGMLLLRPAAATC